MTRMPTNGQHLTGGSGGVLSSVYEFLTARESDTGPIADTARRVLSDWGNESPFLLVTAAESGDAEQVAVLLEDGVDVNLADGEGWTALIAAASEGHADIATALLAIPGIDVNACNHDQETALLRATAGGHVEIVGALLAVEGLDVNAATATGKSALIIAASTGDDALVELLLTEGVGLDVNARDNSGNTALIHAALEGHLPVVQALVTSDDLDMDVAVGGSTALMLAVRKMHSEIASALRIGKRERAVKTARQAALSSR